MKHIVVTHAGSFHADEAMAVALLEKFYFPYATQMSVGVDSSVHLEWLKGNQSPTTDAVFYADGVEECRTPIVVIRTRDAALLKTAKANRDVFVIDVGGEFDASALNFDHHQRSMSQRWEDGTPLSSTGLIWKWLLAQGHLNGLHDEVRDELQEKVVKPLDAHDNGVATSPVASQLAGYNRTSDNTDEQNRQFGKAKQLMMDTLENAIFSAELKLEAKTVLRKGWTKAQQVGDTHVLLRDHISYHDCATLLRDISNGKADMIIIPGQGNRFSVISTPLDKAFSIKCPCPSEWWGKMDQKVTINGKDIMVRFAHKTGFMCVVEGSHKDAQQVARHIIAVNRSLPLKKRGP